MEILSVNKKTTQQDLQEKEAIISKKKIKTTENLYKEKTEKKTKRRLMKVTDR